MPPRGGHGGPPPVDGGRGASGFYNYDFGMSEAQSRIDYHRAVGRAPEQGGQWGFVEAERFSLLGIWHRLQLARVFSLHRPQGVGRVRSFIGNYQVLAHDSAMKARFTKMEALLTKRYKADEIDAQFYGDRIMYEADRYYSWLLRKTVITEEQYREAMTKFAEEHGIEYDFGDSAPARSR